MCAVNDAVRPCPPRVDFLVLSVNDKETDETDKVFGLDYSSDEGGLPVRWGFIDLNGGSGKSTVALVSLNDKQGRAEAVTLTGRAISHLRPSYLLVLGTAGGFARGEQKVRTGDLVISYVIHSGTTKGSELRAEPVCPPSVELVEYAHEVVRKNTWTASIEIHPPTRRKPNVILKREMVSTEILVNDENRRLVKRLLAGLPRLMAAEMESGGVAKLVCERCSTERVPGYLVIKGISDIVDAKINYSTARKRGGKDGKRRVHKRASRDEENQEERDKWSRYASHVSAAFARDLIARFKPRRYRPTSIERLAPNGYLGSAGHNVDCSGVLYRVDAKVYSALAAYHLENAAPEVMSDKHVFFTVCAFDPVQLWNVVNRRYYRGKVEQIRKKKLTDCALDELIGCALDEFHHFRVFRKVAADHPDRCIRIVLLDNFDTWTSNLEPYHWEFFRAVTEGVPCWAAQRCSFPTAFLTDCVIIGGRLLLDYYDDSSILIMTDIQEPEVAAYFKGLEYRFDEWQSTSHKTPLFRPFEWLDAGAKKKFQAGTGRK